MGSGTKAERALPVRVVDFLTHKYGRELQVDVAWIHEMPGYIDWDEPYSLTFYDVTLVRGGSGRFWLDTRAYPVEPGTVFFTSPGQVRRWVARDLDALCLFFPAEFMEGFVHDPLFLHGLRYFHHPAGPHAIRLEDAESGPVLDRLRAMRAEFESLRPDSPDLIRAIAYETLIRLNRVYGHRHGYRADGPGNHLASRFRQLVEERFRSHHRVGWYARQLGVTPGHLSQTSRRHLGSPAGRVLAQRILLEARRLLVHSDRTVSRIGESLGFVDPSYFSRFCRQRLGVPPSRYRARARAELGGIGTLPPAAR